MKNNLIKKIITVSMSFMLLLLAEGLFAESAENVGNVGNVRNAKNVGSEVVLPTQRVVEDNVEITIDFSKTDINRLSVDHEKITAIHTPDNSLLAHNDPFGSVYVSVLTDKPFTAYVTTDSGLHFSLLVTPKNEPGQTLLLKPMHKINRNPLLLGKSSLQSQHFEKGSDYEKILIQLIQFAMNGETPPGYAEIPANHLESIPEYAILPNLEKDGVKVKQKIQSVYLGDHFVVRVLKIENSGKAVLTLSSNLFYQTGLCAVSIAKESLASKEMTSVIEVLRSV